MALSTYLSLQLNMGMVLGGFLFLKIKIEFGSSMVLKCQAILDLEFFLLLNFGQFQVNN
jgi:hypothetical protein